MQLKQFLAYYPKSNILVLDMVELQDNRQGTLQKVFQILDVDDFYCEGYSRVFHESSKRRRKNRLGKFLIRLPKGKGVKRLLPPQLTSVEIHCERPILDAQLKQYLIEHSFKTMWHNYDALQGRSLRLGACSADWRCTIDSVHYLSAAQSS